jgi:hypothetical protein
MNNIVWILIAETLAIGSGCARPDWIESTLVTVDLTGVWQGTSTRDGAPGPGNITLTLQQGRIQGDRAGRPELFPASGKSQRRGDD